MAELSLKNPRTNYWLGEKIAQADHVKTRRALEREPTGSQPRALSRTGQRMTARTFWRQPQPWSGNR